MADEDPSKEEDPQTSRHRGAHPSRSRGWHSPRRLAAGRSRSRDTPASPHRASGRSQSQGHPESDGRGAHPQSDVPSEKRVWAVRGTGRVFEKKEEALDQVLEQKAVNHHFHHHANMREFRADDLRAAKAFADDRAKITAEGRREERKRRWSLKKLATGLTGGAVSLLSLYQLSRAYPDEFAALRRRVCGPPPARSLWRAKATPRGRLEKLKAILCGDDQ